MILLWVWVTLCSSTLPWCQDVTFAEVVHLNFNVPFRRRFSPNFLANWNEIKNDIAHMVRHYNDDVVSWSLTPN
jgi:hypothetical protein